MISFVDLINLTFVLFIVFLFYSFKKIDLRESLVFFVLILISVFIYVFYPLELIFPDQKIYLNCVQEIRSALYDMRAYDCIDEQAQESFASKAIERFSLIFALIPIPFYYSTLSGALANKIFILFFYIFISKKYFQKTLLLFFIPSLMLFSSLFLKETLAILVLISGMAGAFHNKKIIFFICISLLILIKIQAAFFLFIFGIAALLQKIFFGRKKTAMIAIFSLMLIMLSVEDKLIDKINDYVYIFSVNAIKTGGISEQEFEVNSTESLSSISKENKINPLFSECIVLNLSRNQCKTHINTWESSNLNLHLLTLEEIKNKRASLDQNMIIKNPRNILIKDFTVEYKGYFEIIKNSPNFIVRGAMSPGHSDIKIQLIAFIEKLMLIALFVYYLLNSTKELHAPVIIFCLSSNMILGLIIFNQGTLWRYTMPIFISAIFLTQIKKTKDLSV